MRSRSRKQARRLSLHIWCTSTQNQSGRFSEGNCRPWKKRAFQALGEPAQRVRISLSLSLGFHVENVGSCLHHLRRRLARAGERTHLALHVLELGELERLLRRRFLRLDELFRVTFRSLRSRSSSPN